MDRDQWSAVAYGLAGKRGPESGRATGDHSDKGADFVDEQ
jgi:hypothetical protein